MVFTCPSFSPPHSAAVSCRAAMAGGAQFLSLRAAAV